MPLAMTIDTQSGGNVEVRVTVTPFDESSARDLRVYWKSDEYSKIDGGAAPVPDLAGHEGTLFHDVQTYSTYKVDLSHKSPGKSFQVCARLEPPEAEGETCETSKGQ